MSGYPLHLSSTIFSEYRPAMHRYVRQKPITRLLWFPLLDSIAVAGTRVTAAINCGFLFCLFSISVLYWALLLWFPLCGNKPGQRDREEKTELCCSFQSKLFQKKKKKVREKFRRKLEPRGCQGHINLVYHAHKSANIKSFIHSIEQYHNTTTETHTHTPQLQQGNQQKSNHNTSAKGRQSQTAATSRQSKQASTQTWQHKWASFNMQMIIDAIWSQL